jgi:murein DD-endopeptidase MepM/ murein hydrolase activator NlpD
MRFTVSLSRLLPLALVLLAGCDQGTETTNPPVLGVSASSLAFTAQQGTNPSAQTLTISNAGEGTLGWNASPSSGWLSMSASSGSLGTGASTLVAISLNTAGMASGTYTGTIEMSAQGASGSPRTVTVTLTITPGPALQVGATSLSFSAQQGSTPAMQTFTVSNSGGGTLNWNAAENLGWLTISPSSGSLAAGASISVTVSVNTSGLTSGSHTGAIELSAPGATGSPRSVAVTLAVAAAPALTVNPASVSFIAQQGSNPAGQSLTISNTGGGPLDWSASESIAWLVGSPASGSLVAGQSASLGISVNTAGLTAGTYSGTITVTAAGATGSPRTVDITLTVTAPPPAPVLSVSPASLAFTAQQGSNPAGQSLTISNTGGGTLDWSASEPIPWLVGSPASGSLAAGQSASLGISVNTAGLTAGTYSGTLTITAAGATGSPRTVDVTLTVTAPPPPTVLSVSPASLTFTAQQGSNPAGQTLTISNTGGGTLTWSASEPIPWLVGSPASGSLAAGQSASMSISVNAAGLVAGTYSGTITITAAGTTGSPRTVDVSLTVTAPPPPPVLGVSPATFTFTSEQGSTPAGQTLTITNTGSGTLNWSATEPIPWLVGSPASGSLAAGQSASMSISVNTAGLTAGTYTGTITVSAPGAEGSPRSAAVTLTIASHPLPAPSLLSPVDGTAGVSVNPTFSWSAVIGANRYWLMVATDASAFPGDPNATSCPGCVISGNTGTTSHTLPADFPYPGQSGSLNANTRYFWKVKAWNSSGSQGGYPTASNFTTTPASPTLRIDGQTASTRAIGETFVSSGSGYTPNRTVTRYLKDPSGNQITLMPVLTADGAGNISWSFTPVCTTPLWTSTLWAFDDASGRTSNTVTQTVTASSSCNAPRIDALSPASPTSSSTDQTVRVTGSGFQPGLTVTATFPNGANGTLNPPGQILDVTATAFDMRITLGATGRWGIRVNNPGGQQSNTFVFDVRSGDSGFTWPVDPANASNGYYASCADWPSHPSGCYWLNANGWRDAQPFRRHFFAGYGYHLGADWNLGAGSNDANLPVYAVADGEVSDVRTNVSGWGNIVFVRHTTSFGTYTSMYAHVNWNTVGPPTKGQRVAKGQQIARVGNGNGLYPYHLHLEIRTGDNVQPGPGYTASPTTTPPQGQMDPNAFIASHR